MTVAELDEESSDISCFIGPLNTELEKSRYTGIRSEMGRVVLFKRFLVSSLLFIAVLCLLASTESAAASLNVVDGQLLGASDINVGGNFFDVAFLDGTCIAIFRECDSAANFTFTFTTENDAVLAAQALLDQVFLDSTGGPFDTSPSRTAGCRNPSLCLAYIPYDVDDARFAPILVAAAFNAIPEWRDSAFGGVDVFFSSNTFVSDAVWTVWTPVPEPSAALFMLLGLAGLGWARLAKHA